MILSSAVFICCVLVGWAYVFYPLSLLVLSAFAKKVKVGECEPDVTLIISAFNEHAVIREKIENSLALSYPGQKLEVMVISDASDDGTDEVVMSFCDQEVILCRQESRGGKSQGLTRFVPTATGEILVFSDANSMYAPDAIRKLARHFADPKVGYVVGHQRYVDATSSAADSESLYWRYETWLKTLESRVGSVVGGDGAIFAIRASLFEPLRADDINDFVIPLKIITKGYRGVFDREAVCYEQTADTFGGEFRRKIRIVSRSLRAVTRVSQALNPFRVGLFAYQLAVHKLLRWFVPFLLVGALLASAILAWRGEVLYQVLLIVQMAFYGLAMLRFVPWIGRLKPVYIAYYFCIVNLAAGLGIIAMVSGARFATWTPQRPLEEQNGVATRT